MSCKVCKGLGYVEKDDKLYECDCERWRRIALSMDVHIRKAACKDEHISHPLVDMVRESCFVIGSWADLKAIIKVATIKYWPRLVKITSDREIRDVGVGDKSKKAHSEDYAGKDVYNTLADLMDLPDLMVVRLGELNYKNKAASGYLEEALAYRFDRSKPTWVLSNIDHPFTAGSHAYSDQVMELLHSACKQVNVSRIIPKLVVTNSIIAIPDASPLSMEPAPPRKAPSNFGRDPDAKPVRPRIQSIPDDEDTSTLDTIGQGVSKSKKFRTRD